jgi:hypothetical protein
MKRKKKLLVGAGCTYSLCAVLYTPQWAFFFFFLFIPLLCSAFVFWREEGRRGGFNDLPPHTCSIALLLKIECSLAHPLLLYQGLLFRRLKRKASVPAGEEKRREAGRASHVRYLEYNF